LIKLEEGNVVYNKSMDKKLVVINPRELAVNERFVCSGPHQDGDYSYLCKSDYCRCSQ